MPRVDGQAGRRAQRRRSSVLDAPAAAALATPPNEPTSGAQEAYQKWEQLRCVTIEYKAVVYVIIRPVPAI